MTASKIEWTDWNPIRGCTRVSPGCGGPGPHGGCYAEAIAARFSDPGQAFHGYAERTPSGPRWTGNVEIQEDRLDLPLRWRKPAKIFVSSTSDLFHEKLPDAAIDRIFAIMALAPQHTFQVLTKRAERMRAYLCGLVDESNDDPRQPHQRILAASENAGFPWNKAMYDHLRDLCEMDEPCLPLPNVWLGVSVEDQARADERIPHLLATPAAVRFLSCEPLLGPIDLREYLVDPATDWMLSPKLAIHWLICGGESGPNARPMDPAWARSLRDQCAAAGVAFHFKQWGRFAGGAFIGSRKGPAPAHEFADGTRVFDVGKAAAGRLLDGRTHDEFPA